MSDKQETLGVIIPTYQRAHLLHETIHSVLNQTRQADEIIVVDDGSTDNTADAIKVFAGKVRYIRQANKGVSAARNTGILNATTDLIFFLDSDDTLLPEALSALADIFANHPDTDVVYGGSRYTDFDSKPIKDYPAPQLPQEPMSLFLPSNKLLIQCALIRRLSIAASGMFDPHMRHAEDMDFWIRLAHSGARFQRTSQIVINYRCHTESLSANTLMMYQGRMTACKRFAKASKGNPAYQKLARQSIRESRIEEIVARCMVPCLRNLGPMTIVKCLAQWFDIAFHTPRSALYTFHAMARGVKFLLKKTRRPSGSDA